MLQLFVYWHVDSDRFEIFLVEIQKSCVFAVCYAVQHYVVGKIITICYKDVEGVVLNITKRCQNLLM
jgi:hypothetical protein